MLDEKQVENLRNIIVLSFLAYEYGLKDNTGGATHFAKRNISNSWTKKLERTTRIGNHVFYRFS